MQCISPTTSLVINTCSYQIPVDFWALQTLTTNFNFRNFLSTFSGVTINRGLDLSLFSAAPGARLNAQFLTIVGMVFGPI